MVMDKPKCECGSDRVAILTEAAPMWLRKKYTYICLRCGFRWEKEKWALW